jgi:hypothetical protein
MLSWWENLNSHFSSVQSRSRHTRKAMKMYYSVLPKMLWRTLRRAVFWIESHKNELVEVKVTIDFQRQRRKNLVSAQCLTCSGGLVITNFEIPASKFPTVVWGSKYAQLFYFFSWDTENLLLWCVNILYFYDRKYCTSKIFSVPLTYTGMARGILKFKWQTEIMRDSTL